MSKQFPLVLFGNVFFIIGMVMYVKSRSAVEYADLLRWGGTGLMIASAAVNAAFLFSVFKDRKRKKD
jgi:hypothetical protein